MKIIPINIIADLGPQFWGPRSPKSGTWALSGDPSPQNRPQWPYFGDLTQVPKIRQMGTSGNPSPQNWPQCLGPLKMPMWQIVGTQVPRIERAHMHDYVDPIPHNVGIRHMGTFWGPKSPEKAPYDHFWGPRTQVPRIGPYDNFWGPKSPELAPMTISGDPALNLIVEFS